jgi:hypothetical protein
MRYAMLLKLLPLLLQLLVRNDLILSGLNSTTAVSSFSLEPKSIVVLTGIVPMYDTNDGPVTMSMNMSSLSPGTGGVSSVRWTTSLPAGLSPLNDLVAISMVAARSSMNVST